MATRSSRNDRSHRDPRDRHEGESRKDHHEHGHRHADRHGSDRRDPRDRRDHHDDRYRDEPRRSDRHENELSNKMGKMRVNPSVPPTKSSLSHNKKGILPEREREKISKILNAIATEPPSGADILRRRPTGKFVRLGNEFKDCMEKNDLAYDFYRALKVVQEGPARRK